MSKREDNLFSSNKDIWASEDMVKGYFSRNHLYGPERRVLDKFRSELNHMRMLDIGVGAGRTTHFFANLVKEYIGIDYSMGMINACRQKFGNAPGNISFEVCDTRSLAPFQDNYFDFILFSFNGIDCIDHEDRLKALREIHRVGKNGALFLFSTHNLERADTLLRVKLSFHPRALINEFRRVTSVRLLNKDFRKFKSMDYAIINEPYYGSQIKAYYIKPKEQVKQLEDAGFRNIAAHSSSDGKEILDRSKSYAELDDWVYFSCNIYK